MTGHTHRPPVDPVRLHDQIRALFAGNPFSRDMGMVLIEAAEGTALVSMQVGDGLMNAHGGCHGGAVWTLADMTFGAAGYHEGPMLTVGSDLTFIRPAPGGATLWASGREITRKGRTALFEIVISTSPGDARTVVAAGTFTGRWYASHHDPG